MLVSKYAAEECHLSRSNCQQLDFIEKNGDVKQRKDDEDITISLSGKYKFIVTHDVIKRMEEERKLNVMWAYVDKKVKEGPKYKLSRELVLVLHRKLRSSALGKHVNGFTKAVITSRTGNETSFYAHPWFQGNKWYDWALVHFEEQIKKGHIIKSYYPSKVLGFIEVDGKREAAIQCCVKPLKWNTVQSKKLFQLHLGLILRIYL